MKTPEEIEMLVLAWQDTRDEDAFNELFQETKGIVYKASDSYRQSKSLDEATIESGCNLALFQACEGFDPSQGSKFTSWLYLVVKRKLASEWYRVRKSKGRLVPLDQERTEDGQTLNDVVDDPTEALPDELVDEQISHDVVMDTFDEGLSDLESDTLRLKLEGGSYVEIAEKLGRNTKSIDNARQRLKRKSFKIKTHLQDKGLMLPERGFEDVLEGSKSVKRARKHHCKTIEEKFWRDVEKSGEHWIWKGHWIDQGIYGIGQLSFHRKVYTAHRYAWELEHPKLERKQALRKTCSVERCIAPACHKIVIQGSWGNKTLKSTQTSKLVESPEAKRQASADSAIIEVSSL